MRVLILAQESEFGPEPIVVRDLILARASIEGYNNMNMGNINSLVTRIKHGGNGGDREGKGTDGEQNMGKRGRVEEAGS